MDLTEILEQHALWLRTVGSEGVRANLRGADLRRANLIGAILSGADMRGADLYGADLSEADLSGADLYGADLYGANLRRANLRRADLRGADLSEADLSGADLRRADLYGANLCRADLIGANLRDSSGLPIATDARHRLRAVAMAALADSDALRMSAWHTCQTTHCIAGWAIHQAGELGRILEALHGADLAGRFLLGHEAALHFHDDDAAAKAWLQSVLDAPEAA